MLFTYSIWRQVCNLYYWVEWKVFAFFKWKINNFLNIFTIFNQLYNFHCFLLPSPNVSQAFQFRPCKNLVAYTYAISSKTQKLSIQPNIYHLHFMLMVVVWVDTSQTRRPPPTSSPQWDPQLSYDSDLAYTGIKYNFYTSCLYQCLSGMTSISLLSVYYHNEQNTFVTFQFTEYGWNILNNTATNY
jgi:hypothetical protein